MFQHPSIKARIGVLVSALMLACSMAIAAEPDEGVQVLKFDRPANVASMPENFRTNQSDFKRVHGDVYPTREGLEELNDSGSSVFSKNEFQSLLKQIPADKKDIVVVDLRDESHGYINGHAVSWYSRYKTFNKGLSAEQVMEREEALLKAAQKAGTVEVAMQAKDKSNSSVAPIQGESVMKEKELGEPQGAKNYRIPSMG